MIFMVPNSINAKKCSLNRSSAYMSVNFRLFSHSKIFLNIADLVTNLCESLTNLTSQSFNYHHRPSFFYRPQTKFAKVMFLHLSVIYSVHRGGRASQGGMCGRGGHVWWGGHVWQRGMHGQGSCMAGGMCGGGACVVGRGHAWQGGHACAGGCACHAHRPRTLRDTVGQCAGGTHPTGMHSCWYINVV